MDNTTPKNWNRITLGELLDYERPDKYIVSSEDYSDNYKIPVLTAGKTFILGYTNEKDGIYKNTPVIIFDDFTTESKYVDFDFKVKSSAMKILKAKNNITLKYLYYLMKTIHFDHETHKRYWISEYSKLKIDIPENLEEQQEIVQVLDTMSDIIRLRTECIKHAQDLIPTIFQEMFDNPKTNKKNLNKIKIGNVLSLSSGKFLPAKEMNENGIYSVYGGNGINGHHNKYLFEEPQLCIGRVGVKCGCIHLTQPKSWITDNALYVNQLLEPINIIYLKEALTQINLNLYAKRVAQPVISQSTIYNQYILEPSIELQEQFAQKAIEIENYIQEQQEELKIAKQMFKTLLHHAFAGELTKHKFGEINE